MSSDEEYAESFSEPVDTVLENSPHAAVSTSNTPSEMAHATYFSAGAP